MLFIVCDWIYEIDRMTMSKYGFYKSYNLCLCNFVDFTVNPNMHAIFI